CGSRESQINAILTLRTRSCYSPGMAHSSSAAFLDPDSRPRLSGVPPMTATKNAYTQLVNRLHELYLDACEEYQTSEACRQLCDCLEDLVKRAQHETEYQEERCPECGQEQERCFCLDLG